MIFKYEALAMGVYQDFHKRGTSWEILPDERAQWDY
jgi:hypothetical protein